MARSKLRRKRGSCRRRQAIAQFRPQGRNAGPSGTTESIPPELIVDTIYVQTGSPNLVHQPQTNAVLEKQSSKARLIRVRVNKRHQTIYSADDAMGTSYTYPAGPVLFGGPLSRFTSLIQMSMQRDLIYIDEPINVPLSLLTVMSVNRDPLPITRIAINIDRLTSSDIETVKFAVDNYDLTDLILAISCDSAFASSTGEVDNWGFKRVSKRFLQLSDPQRYRRGLQVVNAFNLVRVDDIEYTFVLEAEARTL